MQLNSLRIPSFTHTHLRRYDPRFPWHALIDKRKTILKKTTEFVMIAVEFVLIERESAAILATAASIKQKYYAGFTITHYLKVTFLLENSVVDLQYWFSCL